MTSRDRPASPGMRAKRASVGMPGPLSGAGSLSPSCRSIQQAVACRTQSRSACILLIPLRGYPNQTSISLRVDKTGAPCVKVRSLIWQGTQVLGSVDNHLRIKNNRGRKFFPEESRGLRIFCRIFLNRVLIAEECEDRLSFSCDPGIPS